MVELGQAGSAIIRFIHLSCVAFVLGIPFLFVCDILHMYSIHPLRWILFLVAGVSALLELPAENNLQNQPRGDASNRATAFAHFPNRRESIAHR